MTYFVPVLTESILEQSKCVGQVGFEPTGATDLQSALGHLPTDPCYLLRPTQETGLRYFLSDDTWSLSLITGMDPIVPRLVIRPFSADDLKTLSNALLFFTYSHRESNPD